MWVRRLTTSATAAGQDPTLGRSGRASPRRRGGTNLGRDMNAGAPVTAAGPDLSAVAFSRATTCRPAAPCSIDRVLIGRGDVPEARIRIADGLGGTTEIRLAATGNGRTIAVQVLTATTGSRDTLCDVMKEVRLRLRRRGITLADDPGDHPFQGQAGKEHAR